MARAPYPTGPATTEAELHQLDSDVEHITRHGLAHGGDVEDQEFVVRVCEMVEIAAKVMESAGPTTLEILATNKFSAAEAIRRWYELIYVEPAC